MQNIICKWENFSVLEEEHTNLFKNQYVIAFELDERGNPTQQYFPPQHLFFVDAITKRKNAVSFSNLLSDDSYIGLKQNYLMQIMKTEKDIQKVEQIYTNWDWLEFIIYQQSLIATQILENL